MSSAESSTPLDLETSLHTRPEDVLALRRVKRGPTMSLQEYLDFLTRLEDLSPAVLRERPCFAREATPFEL